MRRLNVLRNRKTNIAKSLPKQALKGGAWNVRLLGATEGKGDPKLKMECILAVCSSRKWDFAVFSDVRFSRKGVREYVHEGRTWTLIIRGKVASLLSDHLTRNWRDSGSMIHVSGRPDSPTNRTMGVVINRRGWRRGLALVAVYAPLSDRAHAAERSTFYDDLRHVEHLCSGPNHFLVIGGDFNSEVGSPNTDEERRHIGFHGNPHRTRAGEELLDFCGINDFVIMSTCFAQQEPSTWWHIGQLTRLTT